MFKKFSLLFLLISTLSITKVNCASDYTNALKDFLREHPTLFYNETQRNEFISASRQEAISFSYMTDIKFYDLDNDKIPEIVINFKLFEGGISRIYKFTEGKYINIGNLDYSPVFYSNGNSTTVGEFTSHTMYSNIYISEDKFYKDTIYLDSIHFYNRIDNKKYDIQKNITLLDKKAVPLKELKFDKEFNEVKKEFENKNKSDVTILINNKSVPPHTMPIIKDNRVFVPVRTIAENTLCTIDWNDKKREVEINHFEDTIKFTLNSKNVYVNNKLELLDTDPVVQNDRVLLPMRFIVEKIGGDVAWIPSTRTVNISYSFNNYEKDYNHDLMGMYYNEKIAKQFKSEINFTEENNASKIMFWTNDYSKDIKINKAEYVNDKLVIKETLFSKDSLNPNELLVIKTHPSENIPRIIITYTDSMGNKKEYSIVDDRRFGGLA